MTHTSRPPPHPHSSPSLHPRSPHHVSRYLQPLGIAYDPTVALPSHHSQVEQGASGFTWPNPGITVFTGTDVTELKSGPIQGGTDLDELSFRTYYCVHIIHYADLIMGEKSSS